MHIRAVRSAACAADISRTPQYIRPTGRRARRKGDFLMKTNKLLITILAVCMLIPSVIAVVSYSTSDGRKISAKAASTLRVSDINGKEFSFEKTGDAEKDKIITIFRDMLDNSEKVSALPDALSGVPFYKVVFTADKIDTVYQFWFSKDDTDTYYTMSDGTTYRVNKSFVEPFLSTDIAQSLYVNSVVPVMTLSGEYSVPPVSAGSEASSWMYRNQSGLFVSAVMSDGEKQSSYDVEGGLAMSFDREPDKFTVTVVGADGTELFSDLYTNIASANIPEGASVSVSASAVWYEDESRDYYGTLNYEFSAVVSAPAEFYPGVTSLAQGSFVSVTAINVKNADKISLSSKPDIGYTPVWFKDGDYVRTLVPFSADLAVGKYELTFTYAGASKTVMIELTDGGYRPREYTVDDAVMQKAYSDEALKTYRDELSKLVSETADTRLWDGYFLANPASGAPISAGFGHMFNLTNKSVSFRHEGVDYKCVEGTAISACNAGKVVFAGEFDYTGRIVVIDHGYGLKTWYCHLSSSTVNVGDEVKRGDKIGTAGSTGFTNQSGVHVSMTVFDRTVLPYSTWEDNTDFTNAGIALGIPMYEKK